MLEKIIVLLTMAFNMALVMSSNTDTRHFYPVANWIFPFVQLHAEYYTFYAEPLVGLCPTHCAKDPKCVAVTWMEAYGGNCYLAMNPAPNLAITLSTVHTLFYTFNQERPSFELGAKYFQGKLIHPSPVSLDDPTCTERCRVNLNCLASTWIKGKCYLFSTMNSEKNKDIVRVDGKSRVYGAYKVDLGFPKRHLEGNATDLA